MIKANDPLNNYQVLIRTWKKYRKKLIKLSFLEGYDILNNHNFINNQYDSEIDA